MIHRIPWTRTFSAIAALAVLPVLTSCASKNNATGGTSCELGETIPCPCADQSQSIAQCNATGDGFDACQCGGGAPDTIPCNVQKVLEQHCWECHGTTPMFGAPTLATAAAFRAKSQKDPAKTVGELAAIRVQDPTQIMPPAPKPQLSQADATVIQMWAKAGNAGGDACSAPPAPTSTATGTAQPTSTATGTAQPTSTSTSTAQPTSTSTSTAVPTGTGTGEPPPAGDVTCYKILTRQDASGAPYTVPTTPDYYNCFSYKLPWGTKKVQVVSIKPIIDNSQVIHHWILYNNSGAVQDGANASCSGAHPDAAFTAGWAPGGQATEMPPDVGLQIAGQGFTLEAHYNNKLGAGQKDASGVELCVTEKMRTHEAAVHWLGTQNLNKISASGTCSPQLTGPVTIISSSPHMHVQGRHMTTVINRVGGGTDTLIDKPFDFNTQISYDTPATINPGDTLTTTCTYAQPTPFGQKTTQEMCYNFVTAYPAGSLKNAISILRQNDCTN